jgi:hypothetical protein
MMRGSKKPVNAGWNSPQREGRDSRPRKDAEKAHRKMNHQTDMHRCARWRRDAGLFLNSGGYDQPGMHLG